MTVKPGAPAALTFKRPADRGLFELAYEIRVVTPVFGGGVRIDEARPHHKKLDEITPLRGTAVRGHLRFWWRATHGCQLESVERMHARECEIWGGTRDEVEGKRRHVTLRIEPVTPLTTRPYAVYERQERGVRATNPALAYGAFPLQPAQRAGDPDPGQLTSLEGSARVIVTGPKEYEQDVVDAVTAWIYLGGIGGRTRRGFGSLACSSFLNAERFLESWKGGAVTLPLVPSLCGVTYRMRPAARDAFAATGAALERMRLFRQAPGVGRNEGFIHGRPGRSRWPEPDAIRLITKAHAPDHKPIQDSRKFPRAAFGAPIIFHFKDNRAGDPDDSTLKPEDKERMASPLILRPLQTGELFAPGAIRLSVPGALDEQFVLSTRKNNTRVDVKLAHRSETSVTVLPSGDILGDFLDYFSK